MNRESLMMEKFHPVDENLMRKENGARCCRAYCSIVACSPAEGLSC